MIFGQFQPYMANGNSADQAFITQKELGGGSFDRKTHFNTVPLFSVRVGAMETPLCQSTYLVVVLASSIHLKCNIIDS